MVYLNPQDRFQVQMRSTDEFIGKDNVVRFNDAFDAWRSWRFSAPTFTRSTHVYMPTKMS